MRRFPLGKCRYIRFPIRQCNMHQMLSLKMWFLTFLQAYRFYSESDRVSFGLHVHKAVKHGRLRNSIQLVEILLFTICPFWICKGGAACSWLTTVIREARWVVSTRVLMQNSDCYDSKWGKKGRLKLYTKERCMLVSNQLRQHLILSTCCSAVIQVTV